MDKQLYIKKNLGGIFSFKIIKEVEMPPDDFKFFIIVDKQGNKFTLNYQQYKHYGFKINDNISCRLDHINCSAEIFFEPVNPRYAEGKVYSFTVIEHKRIVNALELDEDILIVGDEFGKQSWVRCANGLEVESGDSFDAYVEKIKKGRLYLLPAGIQDKALKPNQHLVFSIISKKNTERFGDVYVLNDEWNNTHVIPSCYYHNFNFEIGSKFSGTLKRFSSKGFFYVEPDHPVYKKGEVYTFTVFEIIKSGDKTVAFVLDCFDNPVKVESYENLSKNQKVTCLVISLKKGKPQLMFVDSDR